MLGLDRLWPKRFLPMVMVDWDHKESKTVDHVQGAFFLVRRKVFTELGGFDERFFLYYEDLDFTLRAKQAGWKTFYLAGAQAFHQGGGTTYQIKEQRLFYYFYSLTQYIAKHFGFRAGIGIIMAFVGIEFWTRLVWNLIHFSRITLVNTIRAYGKFVCKIPYLIKEIKRS
jgi:GT2 family glycosyltransferase